jgi:cobalt-precorrin-7 (C5)-methyltransferase
MLYVVGTGVYKAQLTQEVIEIIERGDVIYGSTSAIEMVKDLFLLEKEKNKKLKEIVNYGKETYLKIIEESRFREVVVLSKGDPMVSGLGTVFSGLILGEKLKIVPGISSVQLALSRLGIDLTDVVVVSAHGKIPELEQELELLDYRDMLVLADRKFDLKKLGRREIIILENLGMNGENIKTGRADTLEIESDYSIIYVKKQV